MTKYCAPLKTCTGEISYGEYGKLREICCNDLDGRQQETSEERIRLVIPRLSLGHQSSKTPEFSAEWMFNMETSCRKIKWGNTEFFWGTRSSIFCSQSPAQHPTALSSV